jgi:hypothetical protein
MSRAWFLVLFVAACEGTISGSGGNPIDAPGGGGDDTGVTPDGGGSGSGSGSGGGSGSLTITLTSSPTPNAVYNPRNVLAVWIQQTGGTFVKTINRQAATRKLSLVAWNTAAGAGDVDAVTGATRQNHTNPVNITWDLKDKQGNVIPDGTYTVRMETADSNAATAAKNNQGTFTFVKGPAPQTQNGLANGGFSNVTIKFTP